MSEPVASTRLYLWQPRKRGRPRGPRRMHITADEHGNIYTEALSPFKLQRVSVEQSLPDQAGPTHTSEASERVCTSSTLNAAPLKQPSQITHSPSPPPEADENTTAQLAHLTDHVDYARQLSGYLGRGFLPVNCFGASGRQACLCLPQWNEAAHKLNLREFHLPGIRLSVFEDEQQLTWWCDCTDCLKSARDSFANHDYPDISSACHANRPDKCCHIKALEVICEWRQIALQDLVTAVPDTKLLAVTSSKACLVQSLATQEPQSGVLQVMLVGDPCSDAVAVVRRSAGLFCLSCSARKRKTCQHVKAVHGDHQTKSVNC